MASANILVLVVVVADDRVKLRAAMGMFRFAATSIVEATIAFARQINIVAARRRK